jgi:hypothetical protein
MKSHKCLVTAMLLLAALGIGGCPVEATRPDTPVAGQSSEQPQEQGTAG